MSTLDLSFFDRNHFIIFPKPPLRPLQSQDAKHGIIITGLESSLYSDFLKSLEEEFKQDYDTNEERLCVYFHKGPRIDEGMWNKVWALTNDDSRPLELAKLDVALVPKTVRAPSSNVSSLQGVSEFLSNLSSSAPASAISRRDQCFPLPRFLTEITPLDSVSQISAEGSESDVEDFTEEEESVDPSIPSDAVSLISKAEKDELKWKAKRLDALTRELKEIQLGTKPGLSVATLRDLLDSNANPLLLKSPTSPSTGEVALHKSSTSLLSYATSAAIPTLLVITLVTLSLRSSSPTSAFPPLRLLHKFLTDSHSSTPSAATVVYRSAKPIGAFAGISPHNVGGVLVPFLLVGSAIIGWNVLCKELDIEFEVFGEKGIVGRVVGVFEGSVEVDWDAVKEVLGFAE